MSPSQTAGRDFTIVCAQELIAGEPAITLQMAGPPDAAIQIYRVENGLVLGSPAVLGLRRGATTWIFAESSPYPDAMPMLAQQAFGQLAAAPDMAESLPSVCVLDRLWAGNIWHWFMESLPVVAALEMAGFEGCYIIPADNKACMETLELLGIAGNRIRAARSGGFAAKALFFTQSFHGYNLAQWPWLIDWVRARARQHFPQNPGARRVYVARRGATRAVLNEEEIFARLAEEGFTRAYMEDLSFRDQLCLLRDAQIVIGPHGAGLVYAMFMPKHGTLIELFSARYVNPCMTPVCEILDIDYRMLVSQVNPLDNFRKDEMICVQWEPFLLTLKSALRRV